MSQAKIHWKIGGAPDYTACGLPFDPQQHRKKKQRGVYVNKPTWSYDPDEVTCKGCLASKGLKEFRSNWPPVRVLSSSFRLEGPPDHNRRILELRTPALTPEEVDVLTTLLLERMPSVLHPPDPTAELGYRAAKEAQQRKYAKGA